MGLKVSQKSKKKTDFGRVEDGVYAARVVRIIDLGIQPDINFKTGEQYEWEDGNPKSTPKVWIDFELPTETINIDGEEKPRWYGRKFTVSNHEKAALTQLIKATKCGDDLTKVVDVPIMVQIGSTENGKAKIVGITPLPKGMVVPPLANEIKIFDIDNPDMDLARSLPDFLKEMISLNLVIEPSVAHTVTDEDEDDGEAEEMDIPF